MLINLSHIPILNDRKGFNKLLSIFRVSKRKIFREVVVLGESTVRCFDYLKVMMPQTFKSCSKYHTEGIPRFNLQCGNGTKTTEKGDFIIIEVEMDAQK